MRGASVDTNPVRPCVGCEQNSFYLFNKIFQKWIPNLLCTHNFSTRHQIACTQMIFKTTKHYNLSRHDKNFVNLIKMQMFNFFYLQVCLLNTCTTVPQSITQPLAQEASLHLTSIMRTEELQAKTTFLTLWAWCARRDPLAPAGPPRCPSQATTARACTHLHPLCHGQFH